MNEAYLQLDPDEKILVKTHLHWIQVLPVALSSLIVITALSYGLGWLSANRHLLPVEVPLGAATMLTTVISTFSFLIVAVSYLIYYQNRLILTNRHLIEISQVGLFSRTFSKLTLDEVQDVRGTKRGFWATILNYGEILIETAGSEPNFLFKPVANPLNLAETINDAHQNYAHRKQQS